MQLTFILPTFRIAYRKNNQEEVDRSQEWSGKVAVAKKKKEKKL